MKSVAILAFGLLLIAGGVLCALRSESRKDAAAAQAPGPAAVRIAAVRFHPVMGELERNREGPAKLVREAAAGGARIVVRPEAAVSGYADLTENVVWSEEEGEGLAPVSEVAETADGPSVRFFAGLARECAVWLTVPFIESAGGKYYNTIVLLDPAGTVRIHSRKQHPWTVADPSWMTRGDLGTPVIDTEYGRLGVMVCYDANHLLPEFAAQRADIVLHCVAWYGPWFDVRFNRRVADAGVTLVLANWTCPEDPGWRGAGASRVIGPDGSEVARIARNFGDGVVFADVPLKR
jgi:predicted amidohydrolase